MGMIKHSQSFLHADKHQSFDKLALIFLMEATRHVQSTQNRKLVKKSIATSFVLYCDLKHSDILWASSHVCCYLLLHVRCWMAVVKYGCSILDLNTILKKIWEMTRNLVAYPL